ncbi:hypothetical protein Airi01_052480 [Actinoallomurus iriomotensis]|uniref:Uncharacterized protein n=1 Tax=Actinoallomurus iriomotensis TaxID=478107 RepID=A0A9W6RJ63_9ACTN|nr:hypothetical protein Airi01_052480 [Actinoallomurus iriomotensis]
MVFAGPAHEPAGAAAARARLGKDQIEERGEKLHVTRPCPLPSRHASPVHTLWITSRPRKNKAHEVRRHAEAGRGAISPLRLPAVAGYRLSAVRGGAHAGRPGVRVERDRNRPSQGLAQVVAEARRVAVSPLRQA